MKIKRIVSLAPSNTEIVFALGEGNRLVGVTEYCNYPVQADSIEKIGGFTTPDINKISALSPDLVLAINFHLKTQVISKLQNKGVDVEVVYATTLLDVPKAILQIGRFINREDKAYPLAQYVNNQIETINRKTEHLVQNERPRVCYICSNNPLRIARSMCCVNKFIEVAGGANIELHDESLSLASIARINPDIILVSSGHGETIDLMDYVRNEVILHRTTAYQNNKIYRTEADLITRLGPRAVDGLKKLARIIRPDLFYKD